MILDELESMDDHLERLVNTAADLARTLEVHREDLRAEIERINTALSDDTGAHGEAKHLADAISRYRIDWFAARNQRERDQARHALWVAAGYEMEEEGHGHGD
jgi:ABC-type transporter Mla subunit MlaD